MFMQTVNRVDVEKVWVNFTNSDGATVTIHHPVVKFHGSGTALLKLVREHSLFVLVMVWQLMIQPLVLILLLLTALPMQFMLW